jgi:hypothetical protein
MQEHGARMNSTFVLLTRLQDVKAVMQHILDVCAPEIIWVHVKEERLDSRLPLSSQMKEDADPHDYLDSPMCRIEIGLNRFHTGYDKAFLAQLALEHELINSFQVPLLSPTLVSSLESQQRYWNILKYRVINEEACTWVAKARRVYPVTAGVEPQEERTQVQFVRGFQSITLYAATAWQLFHLEI